MSLAGQMFVLAVKLLAPAIAVLMFVQTAMGVVAKAVPQVNILLMSFPVTIAVGLFGFGICLGIIGRFLGGFAGHDLPGHLGLMLRSLGGG